jgi:hypothetical protein
MRVRIWNAYASNNSGSYTIVGVLPSAEVAAETAAELAKMIEAHTAWHADESGRSDGSKSPLAAFCRIHGLTWSPGVGGHDNWPEYSKDNRPRVAAFGNQIVVHHDYTVSLPPTFGEFFYKKGGRVMHEENHAHHAMVTIATFWWGWTKEQRARMEIEQPRLVAALTAPDGVLATTTAGTWPPAWRVGGMGFDAPLTVGIVFRDLIHGVSALQAAADLHGAHMNVRLSEAPDNHHDPFAHLRPSSPAPLVPRFDVVVTDIGPNWRAVERTFSEVFDAGRWGHQEELIVRGLPAPRAEATAALLRRDGATVDLVRNDG